MLERQASWKVKRETRRWRRLDKSSSSQHHSPCFKSAVFVFLQQHPGLEGRVSLFYRCLSHIDVFISVRLGLGLGLGLGIVFVRLGLGFGLGLGILKLS